MGATGDTLTRIWVSDQAAQAFGPRVDVYRNLPRRPEAAIDVTLQKRWYSLTLDPIWTTPQAIIGVSFGAPGNVTSCHFLTPGTTIMVPGGFDRLSVWAADFLQPTIPANFRLLGYVAFLLGPSAADQPNLAGMKAHPLARILAACNSGDPLGTQVGWVPTNVPRVRIYGRAQNVGNVYLGIQDYMVAGYQMSLDRPYGDVPLSETPDNFVGAGATAGERSRFVMASRGPDFGAPAVILRSLPGFLNVAAINFVNDPLGNVVKSQPLVEAVDVSEIERETFQDLVLYDFTTGANLALDTGIVPVYGMRQIHFYWTWSAGLAAAIAATINEVDDAGTSHLFNAPNIGAVAVTEANVGWGPGCTYQFNVPVGLAADLPQRIRVTTAAAGVGNTTRLRIIGVPK